MSDWTCAFCGAPDSEHRVLDSIVGRVLAGESIASVVGDYDEPRYSAHTIYLLVTAVLSDRLGRTRSKEREERIRDEWQSFAEREKESSRGDTKGG